MEQHLLLGPLIKSKDQDDLTPAMDHFEVSESLIQQVLSKALSQGGDYVDLYFEHTFRNAVSLKDGAVNSCSSNIDYGVGIRVVSGDQTGYAYVESITPENLLEAAKMAARIARSSILVKPLLLQTTKIKKSRYETNTPWEAIAIQEKIPYLLRANELAFSADQRVVKVIASLSDSTSHILFCNSKGQSYYDYRPMATFSVVSVMQKGKQIENGQASRSYRRGFDFLTDKLVDNLVHESIINASLSFEAIKPKGGEMPVVMAAGGSGILLHEAIGHAFEADFNRKNTSIFSGQLNKKICSEQITVVDDATIPFNRGAVNIDDEGILGQKTHIVKEGVLTSYLHDRISANHYGVSPTGNGRRESFRSIPLPRMRATYMENGDCSETDIIASVERGVYVHKFTNGQVQIGAGDFTFFVKLGYLIEKGKLTQPIKDINIIGNGPQALADIVKVGNNKIIDNSSWTCGKEGQSCPVTCGMPSVLVKKLTVGGV